MFILSVVFCAGLSWIYLARYNDILSLKQTEQEQKERIEGLERENRMLKENLNMLSTPEGIERLARERMEKPLQSLEDVQKLPGAGPKVSTQLTNIAVFKSRYFHMKIDCINPESPGGTSFGIVFDRATKQIVRWEEF